jgi:hypothetical protein
MQADARLTLTRDFFRGYLTGLDEELTNNETRMKISNDKLDDTPETCLYAAGGSCANFSLHHLLW